MVYTVYLKFYLFYIFYIIIIFLYYFVLKVSIKFALHACNHGTQEAETERLP